MPFDPYYDANPNQSVDNSVLFDVYDTSPDERGMHDETQESASRYAENQTPKAPKVSPDEALVQHLSYVHTVSQYCSERSHCIAVIYLILSVHICVHHVSRDDASTLRFPACMEPGS